MKRRVCGLAAAVSMIAASANAAPTVEVLHFWTTGGEAAAIQVVQKAFEQAGGRWIDVPIAGGGGGNAMKVLKARFLAGNPPDVTLFAAQIQDWGAQGLLGDIDDVAKADGWDKRLPKAFANAVKYKGRYVAAPIGVERIDTIYANPAVLQKAGVKLTAGWPHDWGEFNKAADKIGKAGLVPLAHGDQPWQDVILFVMTAVGIGGREFYEKSLHQLDKAALSGPTMIRVFDQMRRLKNYTDKGSPGRDWNLATAMVMRGDAGMQIMGSWAKGEFTAAGKKPGQDFLCLGTPGAAGVLVGTSGALVMLKTSAPERVEGQKLLARIVMSDEVQKQFSLAKGGIPPMLGVDSGPFDPCARKSMEDLSKANARDAILQGLGGALSPAMAGAITDVVVRHFDSDMPSREAVRLLVQAVENAK